jgi:hypothetical protein
MERMLSDPAVREAKEKKKKENKAKQYNTTLFGCLPYSTRAPHSPVDRQ